MNAYFTFIIKTALAAVLIILSGCCPPPVLIPVPSCPPPPVITMPELAVDRLPKQPETAPALKALLEDHITLRDTLRQCVGTLEGYRTP